MKFLQKLFGKKSPCTQPKNITDPIANITEWTPLNLGGTSFCTHTAVQKDRKIVFEKTILFHVFPWFFVFFPMFVGYKIFQNEQNQLSSNNLIGVYFGCGLFILIGIWLFLYNRKKIKFDKNLGYYSKGKIKRSTSLAPIEENKNCIQLSKIHALQIVSEYVTGDENSYYSYELNLVLKTGKRLHVIDHGSLYVLRKDTKLLSEFLKIPIWDAVEKD
ncbi:hypothetical protein [Flavicella sediminum]|uniref:hypothetical protein n=1 Tax=Flavicella sediminum TaxID=2585141 RepID=UPI00111E526D|nr:hypothetical protein [Flavicella sediminum]